MIDVLFDDKKTCEDMGAQEEILAMALGLPSSQLSYSKGYLL